MTNSQVRNLVTATTAGKGHAYVISRTFVAMAISAPTLMALWSAVLFVTGIIIFVIDTTFDKTRYKTFALLPLGAGVCSIVISLLLGEIMGIVMYKEVSFLRWFPMGTMWAEFSLS